MLLQRTVQEENMLCSNKQHLLLIYPLLIIPMQISHFMVDMARKQEHMFLLLFIVYMHQPCQQPIMQQWHILSTHRQQ